MNYDRYDTAAAATTAHKTPGDTDNVVAQQIKLTANDVVATSRNTQITDLHYTFTNLNGVPLSKQYFEVTPDKTTLDKDSPITLTIKPAEALSAKGGDGNGNYVAYLHVSQDDLFEDEFIVKLSFTVENDIALATEVDGITTKESDLKGILDTDAAGDNKKTQWYKDQADPRDRLAAGTKENPYLITTSHVGEEIEEGDVIVKATGGNGDLTLSTDTEGITVFSNEKLSGSGAIKGKYVLTGAIEQSSYIDYSSLFQTAAIDVTQDTDDADIAIISDHAFQITAKDKDGNQETAYFIIQSLPVDPNDIEITADTKKLTYGVASNTYSWKAGEDSEDVTKETKAITIKNKSAVDLTFSLADATEPEALYGDTQIFSYTPGLGADVLTVKAGGEETATVTMAPRKVNSTNPNADAKAAANKANEVNGALVLGGDALSDTTVTLSFSRATEGFEITTPGANHTILPEAEVGTNYSYQFEYTKSSTSTIPSWKITAVNKYDAVATPADDPHAAGYYEKNDAGTRTWSVTTDNTVTSGKTYYTKTTLTAAKLKTFTADYGLSIDSEGLLSGVPATETSLEITVTATSIVNDASANFPRIVDVDLVQASSKKGISVTSAGTDISKTKALELSPVGVGANEGAKATVTVTNLTATELEGIQAVLGDKNGNTNIISYTDKTGAIKPSPYWNSGSSI